jgi:hypothetical protein
MWAPAPPRSGRVLPSEYNPDRALFSYLIRFLRIVNACAQRWTKRPAPRAPARAPRTDEPAGTSGTPTRASRSSKSGGAHSRTSTPSAFSATARAAIGSTSPREPYVDKDHAHFAAPISVASGLPPARMRHDPGHISRRILTCILGATPSTVGGNLPQPADHHNSSPDRKKKGERPPERPAPPLSGQARCLARRIDRAS